MAFTEEQMQRYSRHLILKGVGVKGQQKLTICGAAWYDGCAPKGAGKRRCAKRQAV